MLARLLACLSAAKGIFPCPCAATDPGLGGRICLKSDSLRNFLKFAGILLRAVSLSLLSYPEDPAFVPIWLSRYPRLTRPLFWVFIRELGGPAPPFTVPLAFGGNTRGRPNFRYVYMLEPKGDLERDDQGLVKGGWNVE